MRKGVEKERKREREEAKGMKAREIERNSAEEGNEEQEKAGAEAVTYRFGMPDRCAPGPFYKAAYEIKKL